MAKTTAKKTKNPTKKQIIDKQAARLQAKYTDLTKKDATFICRTMADVIKNISVFIPPMNDDCSKHSGETDKNLKHRKECPSCKDMVLDIANSLGNFMCLRKDFLADCKIQSARLGSEAFARNLFRDYVLKTFLYALGSPHGLVPTRSRSFSTH